MSEHTEYHRHGGEIHIVVTVDGKLRDHLCIGNLNENRPDYIKHGDLIVRACNAHKDLLAACEAWMKVESESKPNNPCPDYTWRSAYRKYAAILTIAALTKATN